MLLAYCDNVRHFAIFHALCVLVRMLCMDFAHGPAVYSFDVGHRMYDVAGLWRAVLDSVGWYLLPLVADNGVCKVYASEKDMSKVWCSSACEEGGL